MLAAGTLSARRSTDRTQRHAATARPAKAEADIVKGPFVAALLIVNDKIAVLQTDLVEVLSVEAGQAQAVEPVETRKQSVLRRLGSSRSGAGWCRRVLARECRRDARVTLGGHAGSERFCRVARGHRHLSVGRDPHREFGVHQIEALGTKPPHQQRGA
jgi:hypothetical protein